MCTNRYTYIYTHMSQELSTTDFTRIVEMRFNINAATRLVTYLQFIRSHWEVARVSRASCVLIVSIICHRWNNEQSSNQSLVKSGMRMVDLQTYRVVMSCNRILLKKQLRCSHSACPIKIGLFTFVSSLHRQALTLNHSRERQKNCIILNDTYMHIRK